MIPRAFAWLTVAEIDGDVIAFRARIHTLRRLSAKLVFIVFRQQTMTIQGVLQSFKPIEDLESMSAPEYKGLC